MRLLLLGGTTEALALAELLAATPAPLPGLEVISSLAGRTLAHRMPPGRLRVGGFGGAEGLMAYLRAEGVGVVIDATHPFAAKISRHAATACAALDLPRLQLRRPGWSHRPGDHWIEAADMAQAAAQVPGLARNVFLAVGRQELSAFAGQTGIRFVARMIEQPVPMPLPGCTVVLARGPFEEEDEIRLLRDHGIELVVSKDSGGAASYPKIAAARTLGLPVLLIRRPDAEPGPQAANALKALEWLKAVLPTSNPGKAA